MKEEIQTQEDDIESASYMCTWEIYNDHTATAFSNQVDVPFSGIQDANKIHENHPVFYMHRKNLILTLGWQQMAVPYYMKW